MEAPPATAAEAVLADDLLLRSILQRLPPPADLLRAALASHRWCRAASRAAPLAPPLLGHLFHPVDTLPPTPIPSPANAHYPAVFAPLDHAAAAPRLSLGFAAHAARGFAIQDVQLGLVLLLPSELPKMLLPRVLVLDPASRRSALLPPPPRDAVPNDRWRRTRHVVGVAVLSRAHPSRLCFEAVCVAVDGDRPRAWVASVRDGDCTCDACTPPGTIYWHICNSGRLLALDPRTVELSFLLVPAELGMHFKKYRVGEAPEDGQLCIASAEDQQLQLWVRGDANGNDNGWVLVRQMSIHRVLNTVPSLPRDMMSRMLCTSLTDIDAGRTGKVFIDTEAYGRYSFHLETQKLERLVTDDGKEYGHPIYAYFLAWPPAFLAPSETGGD
ncbi:hypothetical protein ACP70R_046482 [Stipagrostis hirtigluma subsp. patula]